MGITRRELFTAIAYLTMVSDDCDSDVTCEELIQLAVQVADKMIAELDK